ncbi:uncharacterized protein LOC119354883 [Triticum dicoccoides]|uniref:uncharacterized protein LOC119354883 n=1 Tax=Triticum dicoccoides TaxID=85692 RepID=UPI00188EF8FB|nr:uncharacterized protein LOC119354883 [Triticum dicoccoides]
MAYVHPHKRHSSTSEPAPIPSPPTSSLHSLSISSPRGRHHVPPSNKIIHAADCVSRWSPLPPFSDDAESVRLETSPCYTVERMSGAKPLVLALSSPSSSSTEAEVAAVAITERFLPDLLDAVERARARTHDVPRDDEEAKLCLVARVGKVFFQRFCVDGSLVSLDAVRDLAEAGAEGSNSQVRKTFYTNVPSDFLDDMERFAVKTMGLEFVSTKEHYHVKVVDKQGMVSKMSCKCTVQEDGKLAICKIELNQIQPLLEDVSCLSKDLDLRLMLNTNRILIDPEVENAIKSLVSSALVDPNARGGFRRPLGNKLIDERFSIAGVWRTNYKTFGNKSSKMYLRHTGRFVQGSSTGEVSNEVSFKLAGISKRLQDGGNQEGDTLKGMLESAVRMIWDYALSYHKS